MSYPSFKIKSETIIRNNFLTNWLPFLIANFVPMKAPKILQIAIGIPKK
jgi:hypothetical protein